MCKGRLVRDADQVVLKINVRPPQCGEFADSQSRASESHDHIVKPHQFRIGFAMLDHRHELFDSVAIRRRAMWLADGELDQALSWQVVRFDEPFHCLVQRRELQVFGRVGVPFVVEVCRIGFQDFASHLVPKLNPFGRRELNELVKYGPISLTGRMFRASDDFRACHMVLVKPVPFRNRRSPCR